MESIMDFSPKDLLVGLITSVATGGFSWFVADIKSREKITYLDKKLEALGTSLASQASTMAHSHEKLINLDGRLGRSEGDRVEIHRSIERLDASKASKELVDIIRGDIKGIQQSLENRFDRMERFINNLATGIHDKE